MSWDTALETMMPHTVAVYLWASADRYGEATFSTGASTYSCLIQEKLQEVTNFAGETVVSNVTAQVASTSPFEATARYVLNNGSTTIEPTLVALERWYDEDGLHHQTLHFGGV